jgi:hypothetical protein
LLESYGLAPAIAAHLGQQRTGATLVVSDDVRSSRFDRGCEAAVYAGIVTALRETRGIRRIEISADDRAVIVVILHEQDVAVPSALLDQVEARDGIVTRDQQLPRWVLRIPVVPRVIAVDFEQAPTEQAG